MHEVEEGVSQGWICDRILFKAEAQTRAGNGVGDVITDMEAKGIVFNVL
jgi:hypothetical protein